MKNKSPKHKTDAYRKEKESERAGARAREKREDKKMYAQIFLRIILDLQFFCLFFFC